VTQFQLRHAVIALVVRRVYTVFIHSFVYLHSSKNIVHSKMYIQDNKVAYATLTVALYNWRLNTITYQELTKIK